MVLVGAEGDDGGEEEGTVSAAAEREFLERMPHLRSIEWVEA